MKELEKVRDAINKLNFILTKEQKKYTIIIFFHVFNRRIVGDVRPIDSNAFNAGFLDADELYNQPYIKPFADLLNLKSSDHIVVFVCIGIMGIYIFKNIYNAFYIGCQINIPPK